MSFRNASLSALAAWAMLAVPANAAPLDSTADAVLGKPDFATGAGGAPTAANLASPRWLAEDPSSGQLWVADPGAHRVLRFSSAAAFANGAAADLVLGQATFTGSLPNRGGAASASTLNNPGGVAVDQAGRVYVADTSNHRVLVFRPPLASGMDATIVLGQGTFTASLPNRGGSPVASGLNGPLGLALNASDDLFVADQGNDRVQRFRAGAPTADSATSFGAMPPGAASMRAPAAVAVDANGNLWVAEAANNRAVRFDLSSELLGPRADIVLCQADFVATGAAATQSGCNAPSGIALDAAGNVYLSDGGNHRVLRFANPASGAAAAGVFGQPDFTSSLCNGASVPSENRLCAPGSPMLDREGDLLAADTGNGRVLRYDLPLVRAVPSARSLSPAVVRQAPGDLPLTVNGGAFYASSIVELDGVAKPTVFVSRNRLVATLTQGDLATAASHTVRVRNAAPDARVSQALTLTTYPDAPYDRRADRVLGQSAFTTLGGAGEVGGRRLGGANGAALTGPNEPLVGPGGRLFMSDFSGNRVMSWPSVAAFQNAQAADVILGQPDEFSTQCNDGGFTPAAATLCAPDGLAMSPAGALYVADRDNHRVLVFTPPFSTGMPASRVLGQGGSFTTKQPNKGGLSATSLWLPRGVLHAGGMLFVEDANNRRILGYRDPANSEAADFAIGQPDLASSVVEASSARRIYLGARMAMDVQGRLYASFDAENRVLRFSPPFASDMAADLVLGQPDFTSISAMPRSAATLHTPYGMSFDAHGRLLVADVENNRVQVFVPPFSNGMAAADSIAGPGAGGSSSPGTSFLHCFGVLAYGAGDVIVTDFEYHRLLHFSRPLEAAPARLVNLATRVQVRPGDGVAIAGFVVAGPTNKTVAITAAGPSLASYGIASPLANPALTVVRQSDGAVIASNDNWQDASNAAQLQAAGFAPANALEPAALLDLAPGAYTAIVTGDGVHPGVAVVGVYEVDRADAPLINSSTRGFVLGGENVMIAGFVVSGGARNVAIVATGPSLAQYGIANPLANPTLTLVRQSDGATLATNDDWTAAPNAAQIQSAGFAPSHPLESAIMMTLPPGAYTAILSGAGGGTGVGVAAVYVVP